MSESRAQRLQLWLRSTPGGYLHPAINVVETTERGLHWTCKEDLHADSKIVTVPRTLCLSYLNALVDEAYPVFKARRADFTVEAIGFFYLMLQYIHKDVSYWKPYLDALPGPDDVLTTPLWFDERDQQWLAGTDVEHTMAKRKAVYERYYEEGTAILQAAGVDLTSFSWNLFRWAITIFTSRSFPSRSIAPHDSKYWTTYRTNSSGTRQTVLLNMAHVAAADRDFSVLFPVIDAGNHDPTKRVHWDYGSCDFSITMLDACTKGSEVYNNYGPKGNDELLQGYGFCIKDNPHDVVLLTLKAPPTDLQQQLISTHAGYFDEHKEWLPDKATFRLPRLQATDNIAGIFKILPQALVELLTHIIRHEHGLPLDLDAHDQVHRYLPHIARIIMQSLMRKLQMLNSTQPEYDSTRLKQTYARIYRHSQIKITGDYISALQNYMKSLLIDHSANVRLLTLEVILTSAVILPARLEHDFLAGIETNAGTCDIEQLRLAGWEDDVWVLFLTFAWLVEQQSDDAAVCLTSMMATDKVDVVTELADQAEGLLDLVKAAAEQHPQTLWADAAWNATLIRRTGGLIFTNQSFVVPVQDDDGRTKLRTAVCIWA